MKALRLVLWIACGALLGASVFAAATWFGYKWRNAIIGATESKPDNFILNINLMRGVIVGGLSGAIMGTFQQIRRRC